MSEVSPGRAAYEAWWKTAEGVPESPDVTFEQDEDAWEAAAKAGHHAVERRTPSVTGYGPRADMVRLECDRDEARAERDAAYRERARLVAFLAACYPAVMLTDDAEPDWPIVFVETPAGQMSWHIARADLGRFGHVPATTEPTWDGHTTEVKYERLAEMTDRIHRAGGMAGVIASVAAPERTGPYPTAVERDELRTERDGARDVVREMTAALAALGVTELGGAIIAQWRERAGLGEVTP